MDFNENHVAALAIVVAAGSELIALNPKLKSNSWIQLIMAGLRSMFPRKK